MNQGKVLSRQQAQMVLRILQNLPRKFTLDPLDQANISRLEREIKETIARVSDSSGYVCLAEEVWSEFRFILDKLILL